MLGIKDSKRWTIITWLFLIGVLSYMDRANFSVAVPLIMKEFTLDPVQIGWIMSAFTIGYTLLNFPGGFIVHKFGAWKSLVGIVLLWSIMTALTGIAFSFISFLIIRMIFGAFEGPSFPAISRLTDQWIKPSERGLATGLWVAALPVGIVVGTVVCAYMASAWGWKNVFYTFGILGIIIGLLTLKIVKETPAKHPGVSKAELNMLNEANKAQTKVDPNAKPMTALQLLKSPWAWILFLLYFIAGMTFWGNLNWLPTYFMKARGYNLVASGFMSSIPWVLFFIGSLLMGFVSDKVKIGRALWICILLAISAPCIAYAVMTPDISTCLVLFCVSLFCIAGCISLSWSVVYEVFARVDGPKAGGMMITGGSLAGIIAPVLMGYVLKITNSFNIAYYIFAVGSLVAILVCIPLVVKEKSIMRNQAKAA